MVKEKLKKIFCSKKKTNKVLWNLMGFVNVQVRDHYPLSFVRSAWKSLTSQIPWIQLILCENVIVCDSISNGNRSSAQTANFITSPSAFKNNIYLISLWILSDISMRGILILLSFKFSINILHLTEQIWINEA